MDNKGKKLHETHDSLENLKDIAVDGQESAAVDKKDEAPEKQVEQAVAEELEVIKSQLDDKSKKCDEYFNMLQRTAAEYENYRKRTAREKDTLYSEAVSDVVAAFLPAIDSIERAIQVCSKEGSDQSIREGIELVSKQIKSIMDNIGVQEIKTVGEEFNPEVHNAVMHIDDDSYGQNLVVEEFQKGYIYKDKVIRYSMVKVAN